MITPKPYLPSANPNFKCIENTTVNQLTKKTLKEAIPKSNNTSIWDRTVSTAIKASYPNAVIMQISGTLTPSKNLNTYAVSLLIVDNSSNQVISCEVSVKYKLEKEDDTRKVTFEE